MTFTVAVNLEPNVAQDIMASEIPVTLTHVALMKGSEAAVFLQLDEEKYCVARLNSSCPQATLNISLDEEVKIVSDGHVSLFGMSGMDLDDMEDQDSSDEDSELEMESEDEEAPTLTLEEIPMESPTTPSKHDKENVAVKKSIEKKPASKEESPKKPGSKEDSPKKPAKEESAKKTAKDESVKKPANDSVSVEKKKGAEKVVQKVSLGDGLCYEIMRVGNSKGCASKGKRVVVQYLGTLANGKKFDSGKISLTVGAGEVVPGFDRGVEGMLLNEKRRLFIPAKLGYGKNRAGSIPPNSNLVFELTLVKA